MLIGSEDSGEALPTPSKSEGCQTTATTPSELQSINSKPKAKALHLDPDAAYLLTGGLGGLGSSLIIWLIEHGAQMVIVLTRSGDSSQKARRLIAEVAGLGGSLILVAGSVDCKDDVENAISMAGDRTIKGVVHLAMVLKVRLPFPNEFSPPSAYSQSRTTQSST